METESVNLRSGKKKRNEQTKQRISGKSYVTRRNHIIQAIPKPLIEPTCKCKYDCKSISWEWKLKIFNDYHHLANDSEQGTYILGLIQATEINRRRHGKYSDPSQSHKQCTIKYTIPNDEGGVSQVCKTTFQNILGIKHRFLQTLQTKKKEGLSVYKDVRSDNAKRTSFSSDNRQQIIDHVNSFPRDISHYGRSKSEKEYLSPDLNYSRLFLAFKNKYPNTKVSYAYYKKVFKKQFSNLSFRRPRVDTCRTCDMLNLKVLAKNEFSEISQIQLNEHHNQYKMSMNLMATDMANAKLPNYEFSVIAMDLQQVLPVPTLTHSNMYYSHQLSCYNFGIHLGDNNTAFMCMWDESIASRGSSEIASCLFEVINKNDNMINRKKLILWSDNCAGQNKNKTLVFMLFLVNMGIFDEIIQKFLVSGHSFLACDRDFAIIEKRRRVCTNFTPSDLQKMVRTAKLTNPFQVIPMDENHFFSFKDIANNFLNTTKLPISTCSMIKVSSLTPEKVYYKKTFSDEEHWKDFDVFKRNATTELSEINTYSETHIVVREEKRSSGHDSFSTRRA